MMKLTAHAYVLCGHAAAVPNLLKLLEQAGTRIQGNPDVFVRTYPSFTIDDARTLRERATLRGVAGGRTFVIAAPTIASDAQNALLKTFEEPPAGARFFLVVPAPEMLLPTLRSRMQVLHVEGETAVAIVDAKRFLSEPTEKRMQMLAPLLEKGDEDAGHAGRRDLAGTIVFLSDLERILSAKPALHSEGIRSVYRARKYVTDRGALAKALLEQVALLVPKML